MIRIYGDKKKAFGKIIQLPITVKNVEFPIDVVISEVKDYNVIVGNDWFAKYQATLDWQKEKVTLQKNRMLVTKKASYKQRMLF